MVVIYFILLVGVLIFVHELGHFAWAKFFGVRVLKFSLGFGPTIAGFKRGGTEYVIAAIPLGGYVRMLGEGPNDVLSEADQGHAFNHQALWKRTIIMCAGPAMNLLFPVALFFVVFLGDTESIPAVIGTVYPERPAAGALEPGDRVVRANGEAITTFYELGEIIDESAGEEIDLVVERDGERRTVRVTPETVTVRGLLDREERVGQIGITPHHPLAVIGVTSPSSPAAAAGLRTFDRLVVADVFVDRWVDLEDALRHNRGNGVTYRTLRPTRVQNALGGLVEMEVYTPDEGWLVPESGPGDALLRAGIEPADLYVANVSYPSRDQSADLRRGDRLVSLDDRPIALWARMLEDVEAAGDRTHELTWRRGDQLITRRYRLRAAARTAGGGRDERLFIVNTAGDRHLATIDHWRPTDVDEPVPQPSPILYAAEQALEQTAELVELTIYSVIRLFQGRVAMNETIGGPLRIFEETAAASREGPVSYLMLMAFISINLGLINLLPIPMLDGGHLMFFFLEAIARRPVSVRIRQYASLGGLAILVCVVVLAFKVDIERKLPWIIDTVETLFDGDG
jgi:regulator of sigma E protease